METAILFPGQGSQAVAMLENMAADHPIIHDTFREAGEALNFDLARLIREGPEADLNKTENTQPALLAAGVALWRALALPDNAALAGLAGHSLGEYTALVCADALDFADGLRLVRARGLYMQEAVPEGQGAMAAVIGLGGEAVSDVCNAVGEQAGGVEAVNFNAPSQVVIAGEATAVEAAMQNCKEAGAKLAKRLSVSVPSHCALMRPAARRLQALLEETEVRPSRWPVYQNVDASPHNAPASIRDALTRQLYSPVLWVGTINALTGAGAHLFLECGPGKVLSGLNKRIRRDIESLALNDPAGLQTARERLRSDNI
jgi:[acyl-carrier-protein] S-malonyltransferase